ncbi:polysaccharide pyruvyl transferase family protein [Christiangramia sp.]|uniref:polysaccharide pyruvyl transferase family protein n=1 Tax=Christiangramia sp. TaxID=1931228 RepID=UPI00260ADDEA|nr:polysaccharide pyruvyl transferase family protein [Christiangramia sp.]
MPGTKKIPLFWWSEIRLMGKKKENYGDLLSKYIVEKVAGKEAKWVHPKKQAWYNLNKTHYLAAGSILAQATSDSIVWGSGIVDRKLKIANSKFYAVRGPETRKYLIEQGLDCPEVYGDPAVLLPDFYAPKIEKKYELGIIPHYVDFKKISAEYQNVERVKIIDMMTLDIEKTTDEILACEKIISSSLHGVIVPHTYGIPAIWMQFSDKVFGDNIKYKDYFKSVDIYNYKIQRYRDGMKIDDLLDCFKKDQVLPDPDRIKELRNGLINNCPFRNSNINS